MQDNRIYPLEIRKSASPGPEAVRQFRTLEGLGMPVGPGGLVCLTESSFPLQKGVVPIPAGAI